MNLPEYARNPFLNIVREEFLQLAWTVLEFGAFNYSLYGASFVEKAYGENGNKAEFLDIKKGNW
jgi:hypothetical protein